MKLQHAWVAVCVTASAILAAGHTASAGSVFIQGPHLVSMSFKEALPTDYAMKSLTFDGVNYWSVSGQVSGKKGFARYDAAGGLIPRTPTDNYYTYPDTQDFFSLAAGPGTYNTGILGDPDRNFVYARDAFTNKIYQLTYGSTVGWTFAATSLTLAPPGAPTDMRYSQFILNDTGTEWYAHGPFRFSANTSGGLIYRWSNRQDTPGEWPGKYLGAVQLDPYGLLTGEKQSPAGHRMAVMGDCWLTFAGGNSGLTAGTLSAWDHSGNLVDRTLLTLPTGFSFTDESYWSMSYTNGKFWFLANLPTARPQDGYDTSGDYWLGYTVIPEPATMLAMGMGVAGLVRYGRRRLAV